MKIPVPILLALGLSLASLPARELHVSALTGNDANDGSSSDRAFATLRKAAEVIEPGDTVLIGDGVYSHEEPGYDTAVLHLNKHGRPDAWMTWKAAPGARPEIRPANVWHGIRITGSYIILDGLHVTGLNDSLTLIDAMTDGLTREKDGKPYAGNPRFNTNGISVEGGKNPPDQKPHHIIIRNCVVSKMPGGGIPIIQADYVTVEDCTVFDNAWHMRYAGSGITTFHNWQHDDKPGYHIVIQRNRVWNNRTLVPWVSTGKLSDGNGILLDVTDLARSGASNPNADASVSATPAPGSGSSAVATPSPTANPNPAAAGRPKWTARALVANNLSAFNGGSGIHTFRTAHVDIVNNTTYWNGSVVGYDELFPNRSVDVVFLNNIIVPRPGGRVTGNNQNKDIRWDGNVYPIEQNVHRGPNDIVDDPQFLSIARDLRDADFRLQPGSPGRNSAVAELPQPVDLTGKTRPAGSGSDRGAFEQD